MSAMQRSNTVLPSGYVISYDQILPTGETNEFLSSICRLLLDGLTPGGWEAAGRVIADSLTCGDFPYLVLYSPDVLDLTATDVSIIRQCLAFFGKRQDIDIGVDRENAARTKLWAAERACTLTNARFRMWQEGRFSFSPHVESVLHRAQRKISALLEQAGLLDPSLSEFRPRFGPGASTQVPKKNACIGLKLDCVPACSTNLSDSIAATLLGFMRSAKYEASTEVDLPVHLGKVGFVPKNAKELRSTETQPGLNSAWQLGVGERLAKALRLVGIDIRDQSANQRAAMYGSISGALATLDLSSASDTVAWKLIEHLFPEQWFELLSQLRVADVKIGNERVNCAKIAGMGNGFTFPLETMVFWSITSSCVEILRPDRDRVLVYGDDIIVDSGIAECVANTLGELGFTVNQSKSFWTGRFRESCGADYISGTNVRPLYVDGPLTGADFFRLHNFFCKKHPDIARVCKEVIHPSISTTGPAGFGDGHLHTPHWVGTQLKESRKKDGWVGCHFETWTHSVKQLKSDLRKRYVGVGKKREEFLPQRFLLAKAIATYTVESREGPRWHEPKRTPRGVVILHYGRARLRDLALGFSPMTESDAWAVPGTGTLKRTKVYTFETPYA
jgi:hypothetical protein